MRLLTSSCPSVRLSARMKQFGCHWTHFYEIWYEYFSKIYREKFRYHSNLTITCTLRMDQYIFLIISLSVFLRMKKVETKVVEKIKTLILCSINSFRKSCHLCYNVEKYSRAGQAYRWKYDPCALDAVYLGLQTHTQVNTHCFSTARMVGRKRLNVKLYVHWLYC
jgi:hypothetical protein